MTMAKTSTPFTFRYNGILSSEYGIYAVGHDLFNPPKRQARKQIDYRHGTYDFESNMYNDRILRLDCFWFFEREAKVRHDIREVTLWLSRKAQLILEDVEPDKHYVASLYDPSELVPAYHRGQGKQYADIHAASISPAGRFTLAFYCEPFAYSPQTILPVSTGYNNIDYKGTASTPTLIILRNINNVSVRSITIRALSLF